MCTCLQGQFTTVGVCVSKSDVFHKRHIKDTQTDTLVHRLSEGPARHDTNQGPDPVACSKRHTHTRARALTWQSQRRGEDGDSFYPRVTVSLSRGWSAEPSDRNDPLSSATSTLVIQETLLSSCAVRSCPPLFTSARLRI